MQFQRIFEPKTGNQTECRCRCMTETSEHKFDECVDYAISKFYEVLRERSGSQTAAVSDPTAAKAPPKPFVPPEWIGPYKIAGVIGKGGLGIILRAEDE